MSGKVLLVSFLFSQSLDKLSDAEEKQHRTLPHF